MSCRWISRFAAVAGFVAVALCLTSLSLAGSDDGPTKSSTSPDVQSFGPVPEVQFGETRRGDDIIRTLLTDRAMGQEVGSPFTPPGHNSNGAPGHTKHHEEGGPPGHNKERDRGSNSGGNGSTPD